MYVTIVHKHSGDDMIVLNNTDTIFTSGNLGASLGGVELHLKNIMILCIFQIVILQFQKLKLINIKL